MSRWLGETKRDVPFNNISEVTLISSVDNNSLLPRKRSCEKSSLGYLEVMDK